MWRYCDCPHSSGFAPIGTACDGQPMTVSMVSAMKEAAMLGRKKVVRSMRKMKGVVYRTNQKKSMYMDCPRMSAPYES